MCDDQILQTVLYVLYRDRDISDLSVSHFASFAALCVGTVSTVQLSRLRAHYGYAHNIYIRTYAVVSKSQLITVSTAIPPPRSSLVYIYAADGAHTKLKGRLSFGVNYLLLYSRDPNH